MEQKTKVVLIFDGEVGDMLLLSDEQLRLLQFLYNKTYFYDCVNYEIMDKETIFREI